MIHNTIRHLPKLHRVGLASAVALLALIILLPSEDVQASKNIHVMELIPGQKYPLELPLFEQEDVVDNNFDDTSEYEVYTVRRGDTLGKILAEYEQSPQVTHRVVNSGESAKSLKRLKPGDSLLFLTNSSGQLESLHYPMSKTETLIIKANKNGYESFVETKEVEKLVSFAQGSISSNFWNAGVQAGLSNNKIMQLAGIFGWDIDFAQEIRPGDSFNLVFEELYVDGDFIGYGDIVSAEFVNQGDTFTAIRYTDGNYYTPEGRSMRKSFLRAPVNFSHVSSNFNPKRLHPVQKRVKPHRGVDYVAPVGTPIMAAGNGKVVRSSYDKYNGHHVFILHGERYQTKYLHFKSRAVKVGDWVRQGDVIGYLGRTGMVTGAHLHYEFLVDGVHRNPRTVELPKADPIDKKERDSFLLMANQQLSLLENNKRIMLASLN